MYLTDFPLQWVVIGKYLKTGDRVINRAAGFNPATVAQAVLLPECDDFHFPVER
jgi:hypothetical protein